MPKKAPRNSFFYFLHEQYEIFKQNGINFKHGFKDPELSRMASVKWKLLTADERKIYEEMAKSAKLQSSLQPNLGKMDSFGKLISERENLEEVCLKKRKQQKSFIRDQLQILQNKSKISRETFCFIHFQILCETDEGEILPCELGALEYSLKNGIGQEYHVFIDPGPVPIGYMYECLATSGNSHQIPCKNFELAVNDYKSILNNLLNIVDPERKSRNVIVYASAWSIPIIEKCLDWLKERTGSSVSWEIYEAEILFQELQSFADRELTMSIVAKKLSSAIYDYEPNTRCTWHEDRDCKDCALGHVKRICFQFSEYTCSLYDCTLTKHHLPLRVEVPQLELPVHIGKKSKDKFTPPTSNKKENPNVIVYESSADYNSSSSDYEDFVPTVDSKKIGFQPLHMPKTKDIIEMSSMKQAAEMFSPSARSKLVQPKETDNNPPAALLEQPKVELVSSNLGATTLPPGFHPRFPLFNFTAPGFIRLSSLKTSGFSPLPRGCHRPPIVGPTPNVKNIQPKNSLNLAIGDTGVASSSMSTVLPRTLYCGRGVAIEIPSMSASSSLGTSKGRGILAANSFDGKSRGRGILAANGFDDIKQLTHLTLEDL